MKLVFVNIMHEHYQLDSTARISQPPVPLAVLNGVTPKPIETALVDEQTDEVRFKGDAFAFTMATQFASKVYRYADELRAAGIPCRRFAYPLADTWRGFSKGIKGGFVKVLAGEDSRIVGLWICGADASEQAALFGALLGKGLTLGGLRDGLILHPTLGEAALEAVLEGDQ